MLLSPAGNPVLIFSGIALVCIAIALDALAYQGDIAGRRQPGKRHSSQRHWGRLAPDSSIRLVAKSLAGPGHLEPYTVNVVFSLGATASALPMIYLLMRRPITGSSLQVKDYVSGRWNVHAWGIAGGLIWGVGTIANFVASYVPMIGPATSFSMGEGNTMISALWGVFVWKEFRGASGRVRLYLALMFLFFCWA